MSGHIRGGVDDIIYDVVVSQMYELAVAHVK